MEAISLPLLSNTQYAVLLEFALLRCLSTAAILSNLDIGTFPSWGSYTAKGTSRGSRGIWYSSAAGGGRSLVVNIGGAMAAVGEKASLEEYLCGPPYEL
jgi:hypothetical protein